MNVPLADRIEHAKAVRAALEVRLGNCIESRIVHDPDLVLLYDNVEQPLDDLSQDALFPQILVNVPMAEEVALEFLPAKIVFRSPKRVGRCGRWTRKVIPIEEGIGGRRIIDETDEEIVESVVHRVTNLRMRAKELTLRQVRKQLAELRTRESEVAAALADLRATTAPVQL